MSYTKILMMGNFFDIMNVARNGVAGDGKPFIAHFTSADDPWLSWLKILSLKYFEDWPQSIEKCPDQNTKLQKAKSALLMVDIRRSLSKSKFQEFNNWTCQILNTSQTFICDALHKIVHMVQNSATRLVYILGKIIPRSIRELLWSIKINGNSKRKLKAVIIWL